VDEEDISDFDLYTMCTGDFNSSFTPNFKGASKTISLSGFDRKVAAGGQEVELPVRLMNASNVGAISLILNFPAELMEVTDVTMKENDGNLAWSAKGNEMRIGWNSLHPLTFSAGEDLLTIHIRTSGDFSHGDVIRIELAANHLNELADGSYQIIPDALIDIDILEFSTNGIDDPAAGSSLRLENYPNPFSGYTYLAYSLPSEGHITLQINDMLGRKVAVPIDKFESKGKYIFKLDALSLQPGIYTATLTLHGNSGDLVRTIKLVRNW
jgi:hypothetical protein